jgi:hypothetical protein
MFGSLVVVFPTPHEGGALSLRHHGHEWVFDSAKALAAVNQPTIGYAAFFSDIEHEVAPVTSGHRITLTYNLYFDDGRGPVFEKDAVSNVPPQPPNQERFSEAFKALLGNPEFMEDGGTLAFGLRHVYPIEKSLKHVYNVLKGSDAVMYQSMRALGFDPVLYVYYKANENWEEVGEGHDDHLWLNHEDHEDHMNDYDDSPPYGMVDKLISSCGFFQNNDLIEIMQEEGGIPVRQGCGKMDASASDHEASGCELVKWVTPMTAYNRQKTAFGTYGNEATLTWAYGNVCMIVRIGKASDRLAFPTAAEVERVYRRSPYTF